MTDLQVSLIALGSAIVAAVISYNKWQEYKAKKSVERAFSSDHDDVLMIPKNPLAKPQTPLAPAAGERKEPVVVPPSSPGAAAEPPPASDTPRDEGGPEKKSAEPSPVSMEVPKPVRDVPVDTLVDCPIPLTFDGQLHGEKIVSLLQSLRHVGGKPVQFVGQRSDDGWEPVTFGGAYKALVAGVQLANRSGALNELEYSELVTRLRQIADELGAELDVPDMIGVVKSARALHHFVADYDAQLSVNIQSNGTPWSVSTLLAALTRQGFDARTEGRLVMQDGEGTVLFSLSINVAKAADTTSRLTLLLNVPCVVPQRDGFGAMIACAKSLAARLDGTVVDDGDQPLSDAALKEISDQLNTFYAAMETAKVPAGSSRALRLFS